MANIAKVTFSSSGTLILNNGRKVFIEDLAYEDSNLIRSEIKDCQSKTHSFTGNCVIAEQLSTGLLLLL